MAGRQRPADTPERILRIALELFFAQGDTGTSSTDIAGKLGMATSALYYHFKSKADILLELLAEPIAAYSAPAELAASDPPAAELLGVCLDMTVNSRELLALVSTDPAIRAILDERLPARPAVKEGTGACLSLTGSVTPGDRTEILAAALRMLGHEPPSGPVWTFG